MRTIRGSSGLSRCTQTPSRVRLPILNLPTPEGKNKKPARADTPAPRLRLTAFIGLQQLTYKQVLVCNRLCLGLGVEVLEQRLFAGFGYQLADICAIFGDFFDAGA